MTCYKKYHKRLIPMEGYLFFYSLALTGLIILYGSVPNKVCYAHSKGTASINLSGSTEAWTKKWDIEDSALRSPKGLRAGFYRRLPANLDLRIPNGSNGFVSIFPESRHKPARIAARNIKITDATIILSPKVAATQYPRGKWEFVLKINDHPFADPVIINGNDGWLEMEFDLSSHIKKTIDIVIEGRMVGSGRNSTVLIDHLLFTRRDLQKSSDLSPANTHQDRNNLFDDKYNLFLEILHRNEEIRQDRMLDQIHMDIDYDKTGNKHKKKIQLPKK